MAIGRPPKIDLEQMILDADSYIKTANPPIVAEFAHMHDITRSYLYQLADAKKRDGDDRLSNAIKAISEAKEVMLEKKALSGDYAGNMAIFSLKQLGWTDKVEQKTTQTTVDLSNMTTEEIKAILNDDIS